jgi:hypothetical protein
MRRASDHAFARFKARAIITKNLASPMPILIMRRADKAINSTKNIVLIDAMPDITRMVMTQYRNKSM